MLMTVAGLAMTALFPAVRSAPGLSSTPRRLEVATVLALMPVDSDERYLDQSDPASFLENGPEGGADDPESGAEELAPADWMAIRPSRGRAVDKARAIRGVASPGLLPRLASGRSTGRPGYAIDRPHVGLSIRLCRLLF